MSVHKNVEQPETKQSVFFLQNDFDGKDDLSLKFKEEKMRTKNIETALFILTPL